MHTDQNEFISQVLLFIQNVSVCFFSELFFLSRLGREPKIFLWFHQMNQTNDI